jgi:hypothetical protein
LTRTRDAALLAQDRGAGLDVFQISAAEGFTALGHA